MTVTSSPEAKCTKCHQRGHANMLQQLKLPANTGYKRKQQQQQQQFAKRTTFDRFIKITVTHCSKMLSY